MTMKRIAITSNFDDEMYNEQWLNLPPMESAIAEKVCSLLNESTDPRGPDYYQCKDLDYQLYRFKP